MHGSRGMDGREEGEGGSEGSHPWIWIVPPLLPSQGCLAAIGLQEE